MNKEQMLELIENESNKYAKRFYERLVDEGYTLIGESRYKNATTHVRVNCVNNHEYNTVPNNFIIAGNKCRICNSKGQRSNTEEYKQKVQDLTSNEYSVLSEYKTAMDLIKMKHNKCGYKWNVTPNNFLHYSNRCPSCSTLISKGEELIESILKENNFRFTPQDKFNECKNVYRLRFDFGVYDNNELIALIEYQGEQHYKSIKFFGGDQGFKYRQENDNIKREFCKVNNIPLIEIKYTLTDDEVKEYLVSELEAIKCKNNAKCKVNLT